MKYKIELKFIYSDVVHVEADNEKEAERLALEQCDEKYECYYDASIVVED